MNIFNTINPADEFQSSGLTKMETRRPRRVGLGQGNRDKGVATRSIASPHLRRDRP